MFSFQGLFLKVLKRVYYGEELALLRSVSRTVRCLLVDAGRTQIDNINDEFELLQMVSEPNTGSRGGW